MSKLKPTVYVNSRGRKFNTYEIQVDNGLVYLLVIPDELKDNAQILVEAFNSGGRSRTKYEDNVQDARENNPISRDAEAFSNAPMVIPIVPDIGSGDPDYQQLSESCFTRPHDDLKRIDLKVIECIEDAKVKIEQITGRQMQEKVFMNGYSATGVFTQRFALIHPEIVSKCCIGGAAGTIPIPSDKFKYPIGIQNYEELFGKKFDEEGYKRIAFAYYVAEHETKESGNFDLNGDRIKKDVFGNTLDSTQVPAPMHDMSYRSVTTPKDVGIAQREDFGEDLNTRYMNSIQYYKDNGYNISAIVCKGIDHGHMFNGKYNQYVANLLARASEFYENGTGFEYNTEDCVENIDMSYQETREKLAKIVQNVELENGQTIVSNDKKEER